ncbi:hypothetical protein QCA50_006882 [Cerrena zonata]|uniref:Carboxypeptidase n=1 Tax=Cerrena zonata TaxID=2478898 RepID=A0AAW0GG68_9APHY
MFFSLSLAALTVAAIVSASTAQQPFGSQLPIASNAFETYDNGLFSPLEDLNLLSTDSFTTLTHPVFPKHSVRIKKSSDFCDGTVNAYTGYIDIQARHLFFYFFESRSNPETDDVIFWTNGGPGCSSGLGLFMELGPCRIDTANATKFNPYSWNDNANVFFVDQPIGVGFSYADYGETVSTTEEAAKDVAVFVAMFFEHFNKFKGNAFHMAGESYGGRYIPVFASEVYDQNAVLIQNGLTPINLTSVMIGNGCTDDGTMYSAYYEMQCSPASVHPINTIANCVDMRRKVPRCEKMFKESCRDSTDSIACNIALSFCNDAIFNPFMETGYNPYDISKPCEGDISDTLCYPITKNISRYLDRPEVRETLGVDPSIGAYQSCSSDVGARFDINLDGVFPTQFYIAALLERDISVLIYVGASDWICNWLGNDRMSLGLEWYGKEAFNAQELSEWQFNGTAAGLTRSAGPLTFATIYDAGHMVPYDKPEASLEMVKRWLAGESL